MQGHGFARDESCRSVTLDDSRESDCRPTDALGKFCRSQLSRSLPSALEGGFVAKLSIVVEEADETMFWLELIGEGGLLPWNRIKELLAEANEITAIMVASRKTASSCGLTRRAG